MVEADLRLLLEEVMNGRIIARITKYPAVYSLSFRSQTVYVDINAQSIQVGGTILTAKNDPTPTEVQAVITICGFVKAQMEKGE